jgi:hypothetical protein
VGGEEVVTTVSVCVREGGAVIAVSVCGKVSGSVRGHVKKIMLGGG